MNSISKVGLALVVQLATAHAGLITSLIATPSSEIASPNRRAVNAINGSGMSGPGNSGDSHCIGENGLVWTTLGRVSTLNDLNPEITFDLRGDPRHVIALRWNEHDVHRSFATAQPRLLPG